MDRRDFMKTSVLAVGTLLSNSIHANPLLHIFENGMQYRQLPSGERISTIGLGVSKLGASSNEDIRRIADMAIDRGVNIIDTIVSDDRSVVPIVQAIKGKRDKVLLQMHLCIRYPHHTYSVTRSLETVKTAFQEELHKWGTDYADIGLIHMIDSDSTYRRLVDTGIVDYAFQLKWEGIIRNIGFSSHAPAVSRKIISDYKFDAAMLDINAAYDFEPNANSMKLSEDRRALYQECESRGMAVTVMKTFAGGRLLKDDMSPFGRAMTPYQCIQYALDRPAVASCLIGISNLKEMEHTLNFFNATDKERDYSFIGALAYKNMEGVCLYCDHCQPCPQKIDIGSVNKYLDLSKAGDTLAIDHYRKLEHHAGDCISCGICEKRCPFHVKVIERMQEAKTFFGI